MKTTSNDRKRRVLAVGAAVAMALVVTTAFVSAAEAKDEQAPTNTKQALNLAKPLVAQVRQMKPKDREAVAATRKALGYMTPFAEKLHKKVKKEGDDALSSKREFVTSFNELLTVAWYHGLKPKWDYFTKPIGNSFCGGQLRARVPYGDHWRFKHLSWREQKNCYVFQMRPNDEILRTITVWQYQWDTVYSGVGGENAKKLAKMIHELDVASMAKKGRKASKRVTAKKLNKEFSRAQFYYVEGFDVDVEKRVRCLDYYIKGKSRTFDIDLKSYMSPEKGDDAVTIWQTTDACPEVKVFLESVEFAPEKEKK